MIRWTNAEELDSPWRKFATVRACRSLLCGSRKAINHNKRQQLKQVPLIKHALLGTGLRLRQMLVFNDRIAAIEVSNFPTWLDRIGTVLRTRIKQVQILSWGPFLALTLMLGGCATFQQDTTPEGFTTFQLNDSAQVAFFCHHTKDNRGDHIHCSKWILQYYWNF